MEAAQVFVVHDPKQEGERIYVAISIMPGDDMEAIKSRFWSAYLTWHRAKNGELDA